MIKGDGLGIPLIIIESDWGLRGSEECYYEGTETK